MKSLIFTVLIFSSVCSINAQKLSDSTEVYAILEEVFTVCNSVSPEGENSDIIIFERLSKYILYNGSDISRKDKTACDYNNAEDHKIVDEIGKKIKLWLDNIENYKLISYKLQKEGAIDKHALLFSYKSGASKKEITFSFIKVNNAFLLAGIK